ncbi:MAG: hypothetical protein AAFN93_20705 [Bacteroidota bacterium]
MIRKNTKSSDSSSLSKFDNNVNQVSKVDDINFWLEDSGVRTIRIGTDRWKVIMSHELTEYSIDIVAHEEWTSFATILYGIEEGVGNREFYRSVLELNSQLNSAHVALDSNRVVLIGNYPREDSSQYRIYRDLNYFHTTHRYVYEELLSRAEQFDVKLRATQYG